MHRAVKVTIRSPMGVIDTTIIDEIDGGTAVDSDYGAILWSPSCMLLNRYGSGVYDIRGLILSWLVICIWILHVDQHDKILRARSSLRQRHRGGGDRQT